MCAAAALHLDATVPTRDFRYPGTGQVRVYFLTRSGVRAAGLSIDHLEDENHPLSKLFDDARHIFYEPRLVPEDPDGG